MNAALGLLLWARVASAVVVDSEDGPCPIGTGSVRVFALQSQNTSGGWDSDGARYSSGGQWRAYAISTCPDSLLTLYGSDMRFPLTAEQKAALEPLLASLKASVTDPKHLAVWERYAIAARCYAILGRDPLFLAHLYVEGSWTVRDMAVGYYAGLEGPEAVQIVLAAGEDALAKAPDAAAERLVLLHLARVAHRGGYNSQRQSWLARLEARTDLTDEDREGIRRLAVAAEAEAAFQDQALAELDRFLGDPKAGTPAERSEATFLRADLLRRRDRPREALPGYDATIADPLSPPSLVATAKFLAAEIRATTP